MPVALRSFQRQLEHDIYAAWGRVSRPSNVIACSATGSGKTVVLSKFLYDFSGDSIAIAHRQELVSQMSLALGRNGVRHNIIAPPNVRRIIQSIQIAELGTSYYNANAKCRVAGINTFNNQPDEDWMIRCGLAIVDEGHHVLAANEWGRGLKRLPNSYGLFPSATPCRADGKGLGRHADGLADWLVQAPGMREIIEMGFLTDYRWIGAPTADIVLDDDDMSDATGDFNIHKLRAKHHASTQIVGNVVDAYIEYAMGKLGVVFAVDVEEATKIAAAFRAKGVKAEAVSAKTDDLHRAHIIRRFRNREITVLVNVDLFGEGFDLPAIEVVSFARHTASFALYSQQWGRALRLMIESHLGAAWDTFSPAERKARIAASSKPRAIIIDHVGNMERHLGPPDAHWRKNLWTLDKAEKRKGAARKLQPIRLCANKDTDKTGLDVSPCGKSYEKFLVACPYCHHRPEPKERSAPEYVDGEVFELDDEALAALRGQILDSLDTMPGTPYGASPEIIGAARKRHWEKQQTVLQLKNAVAWWAGLQNAQGRSDAESYRRFYYHFGIDTLSMQALPTPQARELLSRVAADLAKSGIDCTLNAGVHLLNH